MPNLPFSLLGRRFSTFEKEARLWNPPKNESGFF
jgi:hypothetical protein